MAFPTMNAQSAQRLFRPLDVTTDIVNLATGPHNLLSVPAVVDVSALEYSFIFAASKDSSPDLAASTADASRVQVALSDGGPTGDNTTVSVLASAITSTVAWADTVPRDVTGTSATDLDADDWINFHVTGQPTTVVGVSEMAVNLSYIYGKPASIN